MNKYHNSSLREDGRVVPIEHYGAENESSHKKFFIAEAVEHPGALTRKAKRAGKSPMEFAREHAHSPGMTGKQARLAITLSKLRKRK